MIYSNTPHKGGRIQRRVRQSRCQ